MLHWKGGARRRCLPRAGAVRFGRHSVGGPKSGMAGDAGFGPTTDRRGQPRFKGALGVKARPGSVADRRPSRSHIPRLRRQRLGPKAAQTPSGLVSETGSMAARARTCATTAKARPAWKTAANSQRSKEKPRLFVQSEHPVPTISPNVAQRPQVLTRCVSGRLSCSQANLRQCGRARTAARYGPGDHGPPDAARGRDGNSHQPPFQSALRRESLTSPKIMR